MNVFLVTINNQIISTVSEEVVLDVVNQKHMGFLPFNEWFCEFAKRVPIIQQFVKDEFGWESLQQPWHDFVVSDEAMTPQLVMGDKNTNLTIQFNLRSIEHELSNSDNYNVLSAIYDFAPIKEVDANTMASFGIVRPTFEVYDLSVNFNQYHIIHNGAVHHQLSVLIRHVIVCNLVAKNALKVLCKSFGL